VAVDEADATEADAAAVADGESVTVVVGHTARAVVRAEPLCDAAVVIPADERHGHAVENRRQQVVEFVGFLALGIPDLVTQISEDDEPIRIDSVEEAEQAHAPDGRVAVEFDAALVAEAGLDAGVVVGDDERRLVTQAGNSGRGSRDGLDERPRLAAAGG
jgi:hypothetical protein